MEAYLDNSATTFLCPSARERMVEAITEGYGNPSSRHRKGLEAERLLKYARSLAANRLWCDDSEIIFTCSGTLSNNTAIFGAAHSLSRRGKRIVTTGIEHPSVEEPMKQLEKEGFEVIRLKAGRDGKVSPQELRAAVSKDTVLVSIMAVNNEVGSIQPIEAARAAVRAAGAPALIHIDAVQAFGKMPLRPAKLGADIVSVSGHKINGPKGVGILYVKKGVKLTPYILGGNQEGGIYSGTQPMPAIMGLAGALEELPDPAETLPKITALRDFFVSEVQRLGGIIVNSPKDALPYVVNISVPGHPSENMVNFLSERGVFISNGSACSKGHRSRVLAAMGLPNEVIDSALRVSFCRFTTKAEVEMLLAGIELGKRILKTTR